MVMVFQLPGYLKSTWRTPGEEELAAAKQKSMANRPKFYIRQNQRSLLNVEGKVEKTKSNGRNNLQLCR
jgi:hypothetical protein